MNVYDFDKTIFYPDSSQTFYLYCLRKHPLAVLRSIPRSAVYAIGHLFGAVRTTKLKEKLFSFLKHIPEPEKLSEEFWDHNSHRIGKWYHARKQSDDVIVSASPEFLLKPVARRLGARLIATRMDPSSGRIEGENCHDHEKVRRFRELFPNAVVHEFYSDSDADSPMARLAQKAFRVDREKLSPWRFGRAKKSGEERSK